MPATAPCPDQDTLERFLLGRVAGPAADTLEEHLAGCTLCASRLERVSAEDELVSVMRRPSAVLEAVDPGQVHSLLSRLERPTQPAAPGPVPGPDEAGRFGPYRVRHELGRGGMGVVYLADDTRLRRPVALKVVRDVRLADAHARARFVREADALARLGHPNIVQIYEVGEHDGRPYLALEYVPGGTLAGHLHGLPQPPSRAADIIATLAEAVQFAHQNGVVHRDLKPGNILLAEPEGASQLADRPGGPNFRLATGQFRPKVADFGLARHLGEDGLTQTGDLLGTPGYMAPEMTRGGAAAVRESPAVDVYALGAILYELLTGRAPFRGETIPDTLEQVRGLDPVPPRRLQPKVPRDLETVTLKCLDKDPAQRYATAAELADDLRRFLRGEPVVARPAGWPERAAKWARRRPAWAAVVGVSAAALVVLVAGGVRYEGRLRHAVQTAEERAADARRERENARANYREARATLGQMLAHVRDPKRGDLPRVRELRSEQQKDALAFYLKVAGQDPDPDPEVRWDVAEARLDASLLQIQLGRPAEARDNLRRAEELLTGLREEHPDDVRFRRAHAETLTQLGFVTDGDEGRRYQGAALAEVEALVALDPASESYRNDLARLCHALGQRAQGANDPTTAERYYTRAVEVRRGLVAEHPDWRAERLALAQTQVNLLLLRQSRVPFAELEPLATELIGTLEELAAADPSDPEALVALASVRTNWAYVLMNRGAADEAEAGLGPAIAGLEAFVTREPGWVHARGTLLNAHGTRGLVRERLGRYAAAAEDFRRVAELAPPASRRENRIRVADFLIRDRQFAAAMAETEAVTTDPAPVPHSGAVYQHLRNCAALLEVGHWGYQPYRDRAARAARALLDQGRQPPSAEWDEWLRAVRTDPVLAPLVALPELRATVGSPRP